MRKTLLIIAIALLVLALAFFGLLRYTKSHSPEEKLSATTGALTVAVEYHRPYKKNRLIFGTEAQKPVVPYGKVWRTGANEATLISFSTAAKFAGKAVAAGKYTLFTIPGPDHWTVILNQQTGQWGLSYAQDKDLLRVEVPVTPAPAMEQFTITLPPGAEGALNLSLHWDQTQVQVPIEPA